VNDGVDTRARATASFPHRLALLTPITRIDLFDPRFAYRFNQYLVDFIKGMLNYIGDTYVYFYK